MGKRRRKKEREADSKTDRGREKGIDQWGERGRPADRQ